MDPVTNPLLAVARGVLEELELDVVLDRVLDAAQALTQAHYAALGVIDVPRTGLARFITRGVDERTRAAIGSLPTGQGVLGTLIKDPRPLRLADVGAHPHSYGFPHGHPAMRTFLGTPIFVDGEAFGNLYLTEKEGGLEFTAADEEALVVLAEFAGVAIDHARRYTGASERRRELEQTVAALRATAEISRAVAGETDPDLVLTLVAKRGRALVSARALMIELVRGGELEIVAAAGELPVELVGRTMELDGTLAEHAMRTRRPQTLDEEMNRVRFEQHGLGSLGADAEAGLVVPLIFRGESYGVLLALDRLSDGPSFSAEDARLLEAFATSAAAAVASAQSASNERLRQRLAAAEAERQRWARELHDETLQSLAAIRLGLATGGRTNDAGSSVALAVEQLGEAIANLRALITELRPAALDQLGLQAALEALAERARDRGIAVDADIDLAYEHGRAATRLSEETETAVYRIVQEALTNAIKHGDAKRAVVELTEGDVMVVLSVRDDGGGFDPDSATAGFGLLGMRERTNLLGGYLHVESRRRGGTILTARIPVQRRPDAASPGRGAPLSRAAAKR